MGRLLCIASFGIYVLTTVLSLRKQHTSPLFHHLYILFEDQIVLENWNCGKENANFLCMKPGSFRTYEKLGFAKLVTPAMRMKHNGPNMGLNVVRSPVLPCHVERTNANCAAPSHLLSRLAKVFVS